VAAEIVVVRHGETEWSAAGKHTSRTDLPLTAAGRSRAAAVGDTLRRRSFALVLCSPLLRARETCELAGFEDVAVIDDDLREWDYGSYEGLTTAEIRSSAPDWVLWRDGCPSGEGPAAVEARADRVLARLRDADGDALAFAHGHILRVLTARWLQMEVAAGARFALDAGGIGVFGFEHENEVLRGWNC
jgi:broad specificity phosphatase PhoE